MTPRFTNLHTNAATASRAPNVPAASGRYRERMPFTSMFQRGDERLMLQRYDEQEDLALVITNADGSRRVPFGDAAALATFQMNMEEFLIRTGWALASFTPERRRYQDRRGFPRVHPDRRRWWTDGPVVVPDVKRTDSTRR